MADLSVNNTYMGGTLSQILEATDIEPGSQVGYELCKTLWQYHPLGGKLVEKPVKLAMSRPRFISVDSIGKEILVEAFLKEWESLKCDTYIRDTTYIKRAYGVAALVYGSPQIPTDKPIDPWDLPNLDLYFNRLDPLNLAGSTVTNQNPNAVDFQQPWTYITAAGQPYHPSRSVILFNETPIYLAFQSSGFGFTGRSVFLRALYPMKSFVQSMITDDMVTYKAGLLIAKQKQAGSIVNRVMDAAAGIKRSLLKQGVTGNVLSIAIDESIEAINLQNTDTAMRTARDNIIANIAAASDVPAMLLKDEAFTQGFGEGTEDARALAQYVHGLREEMRSLYDFFDKIVMHRAWNKEFFETLRNHPDFGSYYKDKSYEQAFYGWKRSFKAEWESLLEEPESEKIRVAEVKVKNIVEVLRTTLPIVDPQNRAILVQWAQDNLNEIPEIFMSQLNIDADLLAEYEPPEGSMPEDKMPRADAQVFAIDGFLKKNTKADDHWITVHPNGEEHEGHPLLLDDTGSVIGGAGGKLNGTKFVNVTKHLKFKPTEKAPEEPPKPPLKSGLKESHPAYALSKKAEEVTATAQTSKELREAYDLHNEILGHINKHASEEDKAAYGHHLLEKYRLAELYNNTLKKEKAAEKKKEKEQFKQSDDAKNVKKVESTFKHSSSDEINKDLTEKFGLAFENGFGDKQKAQEKYEEFKRLTFEGKSKEAYEAYQEYTKLKKGNFGFGKEYDVNGNSAGAKHIKISVGHVNNALEKMNKMGFNVKEALAKGNVAFASTATRLKNNLGCAWQRNGVGYFTIAKRAYDPINHLNEFKRNQRDIEAGKPSWSVGINENVEDYVNFTIRHEMAHALGIQLKSPERLNNLLLKLQKEGKLKTDQPYDGHSDDDVNKVVHWVKWTVGKYATTNIRETDAEICAMVTDPNYKEGTLPKEVEDHVYDLFNKRR